jgi:hypothetical protein
VRLSDKEFLDMAYSLQNGFILKSLHAGLHSDFNQEECKTCGLTQQGSGQLLGMAQFDHSKDRYSPRKLIPVNAKTAGDHLLLKRIAASLSQPELAVKVGVSERMVSALGK